MTNIRGNNPPESATGEGGRDSIAWDAGPCSPRTSLPQCLPNHFFLNFLIYFILFIYVCVGSSLLCEGFLQLRRAGATLHRGARASHYRGLSCCGAQAPDTQAQ